NQRDGLHRQAIARGRVAYEPNSLAGGCPYQAGPRGFASFPQPLEADKVRGKPEKFAEHYNQATLFWNSQSDIEKQHIIRAFRFELSKVQVNAVRRRVVAQLRNVAPELAEALATGLGMTELPDPLPRAMRKTPKPEVSSSEALSLFARPGVEGIKTRRVAIIVAPGTNLSQANTLHRLLLEEGAVPRFVGVQLGPVGDSAEDAIEVEISLETAPAAVWDGMIVPGGEAGLGVLAQSGQALEFLKDQYRHCKPILLLDEADQLLNAAGFPEEVVEAAEDTGLLSLSGSDVASATRSFVSALAQHRHFSRETDPPRI
ncbi:MAG TPA: catalase-related domain-containing protein, partial [Steroidobacteraceae bacterium]